MACWGVRPARTAKRSCKPKPKYRDPKLKESPAGRDCLKVAEACLLENNWADAGTLIAWRNEEVLKVEESVAKVQREPGPDPYKEDWCALASKHLSEGHHQD